MPYATVSDVSTRLGRPISDPLEVAQVQAWLEDVEAIIVSRFTRAGLSLADQIALSDPTLASVVRVEAEAVIRRVRQPDPTRTSTTRAIDDASITERWESKTSTDGWLTGGEWEDLLPTVSSGAFSTRPGFEPDAASVPWV